MREATYKPELKESIDKKWHIKCTISDNNGQIEKITHSGIFDTPEEADKQMRKDCLEKGYLLKN